VIDLAPLSGSRFAVLGLARSGLATMRALAAAEIAAPAWDDSPQRRAEAEAAGIVLRDPAEWHWPAIDSLVMSPGIPLTHPEPHPVAQAARAAGKPVVCDIELLARVVPGRRLVGITGTNGKSTTTALIGHILEAAGVPSEVGGNIGRPVLGTAPLPPGGVYVLEMSSFQLDLIETTRFDIAIWLNITPDHIDRHGDLEGYVAAKRRIFRNQRPGDTAVVGIDDEFSHQAFDAMVAAGVQAIPIAVGRVPSAGIGVKAGILIDARAGIETELNGIATLPGAHNWQNAAAAWAACRVLGVEPATIVAALRTYPGLPHRQERVAAVGAVAYVNDSKATNADATAKALASYPQNIYWILGGTPKEGGVTSLASLFGRVRHAFLIGQATEEFAGQLDGKLAFSRCGDLAGALDRAHALAQAERRQGAVVLLSPACASYDQWPNYEVRGDAFRRMARALPGAVKLGAAP
jgi:UDP-N-acetylmuramoylalanine--D-glutamate ligase